MSELSEIRAVRYRKRPRHNPKHLMVLATVPLQITAFAIDYFAFGEMRVSWWVLGGIYVALVVVCLLLFVVEVSRLINDVRHRDE